jgi:hypothetical protein
MQFAINVPNFGSFSDARLMAELAHEAEDAGWDGFFLWDHIGGDPEKALPMADPWIELASGITSGKERQKDLDTITPYIEAGVTWWQEAFNDSDAHELEVVRTRIQQGPPRPS